MRMFTNARWNWVTVLAMAAVTTTAFAGERGRDRDRHPGYVDGSEFADLADAEDKLVEVSIGAALLRPLASGMAKNDENVAKLLSDLDSIQAVIVQVDEHSSDRARGMIDEMTADLSERGWERIARVREGSDNISVLFLMDDDAIAGITVMVAEGDEGGEVIFVNVAGRIDLELLGEMGGKIGLPGLEALGNIDWDELQDLKSDKSSKRSRGRRTH